MARNLRSVEDPFSFEDAGYDRKKFYTRSVDEKGHKETFHVPVPPAIYGQVGEILDAKVIPEYKTAQAFVRDAIYHRLYEVAEWIERDDIIRVVTVEMMRCRREAQLQELEEMERLVEKTEEVLQKANQLQDWDMMRYAIREGWQDVDAIREPYSGRLSKILTRFKSLLSD